VSQNTRIPDAPKPSDLLFNHGLYRVLLLDIDEMNSVGPDEPKVEFNYDSDRYHQTVKMGHFDRKTKRITIFCTKIFELCCDDPALTNKEEIYQQFQSLLIETLAHEGGHWRLDRRSGWLIWDMPILFYSICLSTAVPTLWFLRLWFKNLYFVDYSPWETIMATITVFAAFLIMLLSFRISSQLAYRLSYHERYARKFETFAKQNPLWKIIVGIKRK